MVEKKTNEIINFIKTQGSFYGAARYFGGVDALINLSEKSPDLKKYIDELLKGTLVFRSQTSRKIYRFKFNVLSVDTENEDGINFLMVTLNLNLKSSLINDLGYIYIAKWVETYCEDMAVDYEFNDQYLNSFRNKSGRIATVNGMKINWDEPPSYREVLEDSFEELVEAMIKTTTINENINSTLVEINNLLSKIKKFSF